MDGMPAIIKIVSVLSLLVTIGTSTTYHVTPIPVQSCPEPSVPCVTLSEFATQIALGNISINGNTTLLLLPGNHTLLVELSVQSVTSFDLMAMQDNSNSTNITAVTIHCSMSGRVTFKYMAYVGIGNIYFKGCTENVFTQIDELNIYDVRMSCHDDCSRGGTGLFLDNRNNVKIERSSFKFFKGTKRFNNMLGSLELTHKIGGALIITGSTVEIISSLFESNMAVYGGGAIYIANSANVTIANTTFKHNQVMDGSGGGIFLRSRSVLSVTNSSTFTNNTAGAYAGAIRVENGSLFISDSLFDTHVGIRYGGTIHSSSSIVTIERSVIRNGSSNLGGGIWARYSFLSLSFTLLESNVAREVGATLAIENTDGFFRGCTFLNNQASVGFVGILTGNILFTDGCTFINNFGSFILLNSNASFLQNITFSNNTNDPTLVTNVTQSQFVFNDLGGAITVLRSDVLFSGSVLLADNNAVNAGAMLIFYSRVTLSSGVWIARNRAKTNGGAGVAYYSDIIVKSDAVIKGNVAGNKGGGLFLISTVIEVFSGTLLIFNNTAIEGGGIYFEQTSKLYVIKGNYELTGNNRDSFINVTFSRNRANLGGAMYVSDYTSSAVCSNEVPIPAPINDCFLQTYQAHIDLPAGFFNTRNYYYHENIAFESAPVLFGGLLDRCTLSALSEAIFNQKLLSTSLDALDYFQMISNVEDNDLISSDPVRVCLCSETPNGEMIPVCDLETTPTMSVKKGATLSVSVVAVNQVDKPLDANIHAELLSFRSGFSEGQAVQQVNITCTPLQYNIVSPDDSDMLLLHADGPCDNAGKSQLNLNISFLPCKCGIGFESSSSPIICECVCDSRLSPRITQCIGDNLIRTSNFWVSYTNVSGSLCLALYPVCPFDYCITSSEEGDPVNLNIEGGSDVQCAFSRTGKLCGKCQEGLSLALGGSNCLKCTNAWLALLIPFAILGVLIVIFVMLCNLTVAIGTINGLVFYANILATNRSIFLPLTFNRIPASFFYISWINLDWGFETCFFEGMDSYAKTWLQLAFPVYIFCIVFAIMVISSQSQRFARLLSGRNPVATLATLILLSYTKVLRVIISALSFARLECIDGSREEFVWSFDGNIGYLQGKHIPLFIVNAMIVIIGLLYTLLLFFGQWLTFCPNWKIFKWMRDTKFISFMDAYYAPYNPKHRYWVGLLLFVRIFLYLVSSYNLTGNPYISLYCIMFAVMCLLVIKQLSSRIYKNWFVDALETSFLTNLMVLSGATLYIRENSGNQTALAFTSFAVVIVTAMFILLYHGYKYVFKKSNVGGMFTITLREKFKHLKSLHKGKERKFTNRDEYNHFTSLREPFLECSSDTEALPLQQQANVNIPRRFKTQITSTVFDFSPQNNEIPLSALIKTEPNGNSDDASKSKTC